MPASYIEESLKTFPEKVAGIILALVTLFQPWGKDAVGQFSRPGIAHAAESSESSHSAANGGLTPSFFPVGVYIYGGKGTFEALATKRGMSYQQWLQATFSDLAEHHCNSVYLANLADNPDVFKEAVRIAVEKGLLVFAQLTGFLYLRPASGQEYYEKVTLETAKRLIPQYRDLPGVVAWMPMEEPAVGDVALLSRYRKELRLLDSKRALYTPHNTIEPFQLDKENLPDWFGFDRYRFRSMFGNYGILLSTPKDMAVRLRAELAQFTAVAAERRRPLIFIMQGYGSDWVGTKDELLKLTNGVVPAESSGWREIEPGKWFGWMKYPPPRYGMRLQCWLGILEGVKGLFVYTYIPWGGDDLGKRELALVDKGGTPSFQWSEFGETISEIKPLFPLFLRWTKEEKSAVRSEDPEVFANTFVDKSTMQRYAVVVNAHIADWDKDSPALPRDKTELRFDVNGLQGLRVAASTDTRLILEGNFAIKEVLTGKESPVDENKTFQLTLPPGGGKILLLQKPVAQTQRPENIRLNE